MSYPSSAWSSCFLISNHSLPLPPGRRPRILISAKSPFSFSPSRRNFKSPFASICRASSSVPGTYFPFTGTGESGCQVPASHTLTDPVITLGNDALKIVIRNRMIFHFHRQTLVPGIERRTLRHRPRFQHTIQFQPEVVVKTRRIMLLHDETVLSFLLYLSRRFGRLLESAFAFVLFQRHAIILLIQRCKGESGQSAT